jgi:Rieske Fe-S protein
MPDHQTDQPDHPATPTALNRLVSNRRVLFHRVGLAALAGGGAVALAACSSDTPGAAPSTASSSNASSAAPTSSSPSASASESASASASGSASASKVPTGTKVAKSQVPVGGGAVLSTAYVVTQPTAGEFKAFTNICTHQGCPVASVTDGEIVCNCHGSHFSITDGSPVAGPAKAPLAAKTVEMSGSDLYISG